MLSASDHGVTLNPSSSTLIELVTVAIIIK
jgi:hypothetical protein